MRSKTAVRKKAAAPPPVTSLIPKKATVRELHLKTSEMIKEVVNGGSFVIEKQGRPVAELRPIFELGTTTKMPDRSEYFRNRPPDPSDSGRILEEDRS